MRSCVATVASCQLLTRSPGRAFGRKKALQVETSTSVEPLPPRASPGRAWFETARRESNAIRLTETALRFAGLQSQQRATVGSIRPAIKSLHACRHRGKGTWASPSTPPLNFNTTQAEMRRRSAPVRAVLHTLALVAVRYAMKSCRFLGRQKSLRAIKTPALGYERHGRKIVQRIVWRMLIKRWV